MSRSISKSINSHDAQISASEKYCKRIADLIDVIKTQGVVICRKSDVALESLAATGFRVIDTGKESLIAIRSGDYVSKLRGKDAIIMVRDEQSPEVTDFTTFLVEYLQTKAGISRITTSSLTSLSSSSLQHIGKLVCISLLEIETPLLATMNPEEMDLLRGVTDVITDIIWLTASDMLGTDSNPDTTLVQGLSRAFMLEQPSLRLSVLDIGKDLLSSSSDADKRVTCAKISEVLVPQHDRDDKEFVQRDEPARVDAAIANSRHGKTTRYGETRDAKVGLMDTLHFEEVREPPSPPAARFIDISVRAVGINAKDVYSLTGRVETTNAATAHEFGGVVETVGEGVEHVAAGDRVVVMAPNYFGTTIRVPAWSAQKLLPGEDFAKMVTIPVAYTTALYALLDRANVRVGETILIHAGAGAFGTAAIKVAQRVGAIVYTAVGSPSKRDFVMGLGVRESHIFHSRNASFVSGVNRATEGRGVDVIINSFVGDLMHDSWRCIAEFGCFVEDAVYSSTKIPFIGPSYLNDSRRYLSCTALDRSSLPLAVYDAANISQAYSYFSPKYRVGKVIVTMEDGDSQVPVKPSRCKAVFNPAKVYLLVGCLGGLGRSLSRWVMARGARKFVFLGRSGCDKPSAKRLVSRMESMGADVTVKVVRGDVSNAADVTSSVETCKTFGVIDGVVQAAMGLHEALFQRMSNEAWHTGIRPKWVGTWNLHNALAVDGRDKKPDFLLLTSSVSGSVGIATESNYCAANDFLDAFARWRRQQGKPAVSIGLGMISEGIQPLNEDAFLQVVDLGIAEDIRFATDVRGNAGQPNTGEQLRELVSRGFEVNNGTLQDPRALILAAALIADQESGGAAQACSLPGGGLASAPWFTPFSATVAASLLPEVDAGSLQGAVLRLIGKRFSGLVLIPPDQVDSRKPLAHFGMDSMIAADFRTWFCNTFKVDMPFLDLLSPLKNLEDPAAAVEGKLAEGKNS
ncbi:hypothetical protein DL768_008912 [Monosporascus sp. mg162]|nr:hypothetical protein DL768_008912 [Monosporascus sp. mg162]